MDGKARAFLFPLSETAKYSLQLPENGGSVRKLDDDPPISWPPSPLSEAGISELIESPKDVEPPELHVVVEQSSHLHRFTLGSAVHNFVVLKANPSCVEDICYINIEQCCIYPDPDSALIWLENPSTALQCVEKIDLERDGRVVTRAVLQPKEICILQPGSWIFELGKGLRFLLHVKTSPDCDQQKLTPLLDDEDKAVFWQRILPKLRKQAHPQAGNPSWATLPAKDRPRHEDVKDRNSVLTNKALANANSRTKPAAKSENKSVPVTQDGTIVANAPRSARIPILRSESSHSPLIGQTPQSKITISSWNGAVAALKKRRTPNIPRAADGWRHEANMLRLVGLHDNLAHMLDHDAASLSIKLRYEPGKSLETYVDEHMQSLLSADACEQIWQQISNGLAFLHSKGILHGDIKPHNIVWSQVDGRAALIDFGLARQTIPGTFHAGGTPCYVAPEYLQRTQSEKNDIWAFGIVIAFAYKYIALPSRSWKLAEVWEDPVELRKMLLWAQHIMQLRPRLLQSQPLLAEMLEVDPERRVASQALVHRLSQKHQLAIERSI